MPLPTIVALTPGDSRDLTPWIRALGDAGLPGLLIREPRRSEASVRALVAVARDHVPTVWLHARSPHDLHTRGAVDGMHLPDDPTFTPPDGPWGRSCHSIEAVRIAWAHGASWTFLSPIHPPTSKPDDRRPPLGLAPFAELDGPIYALGGMTPARHREAMAAGSEGSAVLGDLFGAETPRGAAERLRTWLA
jgi:thiamine-phosphate pyrophosphorylase